MITIPTTELIGCLSAVLPITLNPKDNALAGVAIEWDGEAMHFTVYDVVTGATVRWVPGEGAEGQAGKGDDPEDYDWGGDDGPWRVFIGHADAKEIVKLFKLPSKPWHHPVTLKVSMTGQKLIVERNDMSRGERLLTVSTDNSVLRGIPNIRAMVLSGIGLPTVPPTATRFNGLRLASLGASTSYGVLEFAFGDSDSPTGVIAGSRYAAFIFPADAKHVRPYNILRDGAGLVTS